jgi:hypothetical protein
METILMKTGSSACGERTAFVCDGFVERLART